MADTSQNSGSTTQSTLKGASGAAGHHGLRAEKRVGDKATNALQADGQFNLLNNTLPGDARGWDGVEKDWAGYATTTSIFATSIGGDGGNGGAGGDGGDVWGFGNAGDGGDGGDGGNGGDALAFIGDASTPAGGGNDKISLISTAIGGDGGKGGAGGAGGDVWGLGKAGNGGDGGNGGNGGYAEASIIGVGLSSGAGHDKISLFGKAIGGDGGNAGSGGRPGIGLGGKAGAAGENGDGGSAKVMIQNNYIDAGEGNDQIAISLTAKAGLAGKGFWSAGASGTASIVLTNNVFLGGKGDDTFKLSLSSAAASTSYQISGNKFDGGDGCDTLDLSSSSLKAIIDLVAGTLTLGSSGSNTICSVEAFVGTKHGDKFVLGGDGTVVTGGAGGDLFQLSTDPQQKADTITDFSRWGGDKLLIDADLFGAGLKAGSGIHLAHVADADAAYKWGGGGYFIYDIVGKDNGTLYFDPTGGSGKDAFEVAVLKSKPILSSYDFAIV